MSHFDRAHEMAQLAKAAYLDEEAKEVFAKFGYVNHKFFEDDGAQCHIGWNQNTVVIAFRGTEPTELSDVAADLNAFPRDSVIGGKVHMGFQIEVEKVWDEITDWMRHIFDNEKHDLFICGHSLGGAMATICAARMKQKVDALFTFGSPRVGNQAFIDKCSELVHYRFVNNNDIVPTVPPAFLFYKHHGELCYINARGNYRRMTDWQRFKDKWRGRVSAWKQGQLFDGIKDHDMAKYVAGTKIDDRNYKTKGKKKK